MLLRLEETLEKDAPNLAPMLGILSWVNTRKNQGVSVVREGRELEINSSFVNRYEPTERWWGIEVKFPGA